MNKSGFALTFVLSAIVVLLLALPMASTPMQPIQTYRTYLPVLAQDSPWREPVGFEGRVGGADSATPRGCPHVCVGGNGRLGD